jgi:hypothetical protein
MFFAGTEIKRRSSFGILANKIKGTWTGWPETKKDLRETRREN